MGEVEPAEQVPEFVRRWRELGPLLEALRDREIRQANTSDAILSMRQAFQIAMRDLPPRPSSGLVEWQRFMRLWRQRG